jgi:hypothetical protein
MSSPCPYFFSVVGFPCRRGESSPGAPAAAWQVARRSELARAPEGTLLESLKMHVPAGRSTSRRLVVALVCLGVAAFYLWTLQAGGYHFQFKLPQDGYYDYLGQAFASGQLHLPVTPEPALLATPNPWDPAVPDDLKLWDAVLYKGRYYLYHGPGPAVMLFAPWKLITGRDLPERFAIFLLCFGGFAFSCATLLRWLALAGVKIGLGSLSASILALGLCQSVPYLLNRVFVYEIAIAGAYFSISAGMYFLARSAQSRRVAPWLGASGFMFGMAIACRPHLGVAGVFAFTGLALFYLRSRGIAGLFRSRELMAFAFAFAAVGAAVAMYNFARFGNPFEFGLRYLLTGLNQNRVKLSTEYVLPGLYYWLICPPNISPVFPWVTLEFPFRYPFNEVRPFPPGYFLEGIMGVLYAAPFAAGALLIPFRRRATVAVQQAAVGAPLLLWTALGASLTGLLFLAATGFTTQRYEVDFLPLAVLAALANLFIFISRRAGWTRVLMSAGVALLIAWSTVANMALAVSGPYDDILKLRPAGYVRLARWFSPFERYRPMMNPYVDVALSANLAGVPDRSGEPLVSMGRQVYRYFLYVERANGKFRLISRSDASRVEYVLEERDVRRAEIHLTYNPETRKMITSLNGREVLVHETGTLVTSPAEVTVGENRIDRDVVAPRFTGPIENVSTRVAERRGF